MNLSHRLQVMLRDRLALFRRVANPMNRFLSVREVIEAILFSRHTSLKYPADWISPYDSDESTMIKKEKYDAHLPIKDNILAPYLDLKRRRISSLYLNEIAKFEIGNSLIDESEFNYAEEVNNDNRYKFRGIHNYSMPSLKSFLNNIEGEYYSSINYKGVHIIRHLILYQENRSSPVHAELRYIATKKVFEIDNEDILCGIVSHYGIVLPGFFGNFDIIFQSRFFVSAARCSIALDSKGIVNSISFDHQVQFEAAQKCVELLRVGRLDNIDELIKEFIIQRDHGKDYMDALLGNLLYPSILRYYDYDRYTSGVLLYDGSDLDDFFDALRNNDVKKVISAIVGGFDVSHRDAESGRSPLHVAVESKSWDVVYILTFGRDQTTYSRSDAQWKIGGIHDRIEQFLAGMSDREYVVNALRASEARIDYLSLDNSGCYASTYIKIDEKYPDSVQLSMDVFLRLHAAELEQAKRKGVEYFFVMPKGFPGSPAGTDSAWGAEPN